MLPFSKILTQFRRRYLPLNSKKLFEKCLFPVFRKKKILPGKGFSRTTRLFMRNKSISVKNSEYYRNFCDFDKDFSKR